MSSLLSIFSNSREFNQALIIIIITITKNQNLMMIQMQMQIAMKKKPKESFLKSMAAAE